MTDIYNAPDAELTGGSTPPKPVEYAGFWLRAIAVIVDVIIVNIGVFAVAFGVSLVLGSALGADALGRIGQAIGLIGQWMYFAVMESSPSQATFGKKLFKLKVTDENGERITFARATGRYFGKFISAFILLIGFIMAAFTQKKQGLHDLLASTLVWRMR